MRNTKIKIICKSSWDVVEKEVNEFLKTHDVIDVQYKPVTAGAGCLHINDRVMIVYIDDGEENDR